MGVVCTGQGETLVWGVRIRPTGVPSTGESQSQFRGLRTPSWNSPGKCLSTLGRGCPVPTCLPRTLERTRNPPGYPPLSDCDAHSTGTPKAQFQPTDSGRRCYNKPHTQMALFTGEGAHLLPPYPNQGVPGSMATYGAFMNLCLDRTWGQGQHHSPPIGQVSRWVGDDPGGEEAPPHCGINPGPASGTPRKTNGGHG